MSTRTTGAARAGRLVTGGVAFMVAGLIDIAVAGGRMFRSRFLGR